MKQYLSSVFIIALVVLSFLAGSLQSFSSEPEFSNAVAAGCTVTGPDGSSGTCKFALKNCYFIVKGFDQPIICTWAKAA